MKKIKSRLGKLNDSLPTHLWVGKLTSNKQKRFVNLKEKANK